MTKKELIEKLSKYPDDWNVYVSDEDYDSIALPIYDVVRTNSLDPDENPVIMILY